MTTPEQSAARELTGIDTMIDAIARDALEKARRIEKAEKYRNNPGPIVAPQGCSALML